MYKHLIWTNSPSSKILNLFLGVKSKPNFGRHKHQTSVIKTLHVDLICDSIVQINKSQKQIVTHPLLTY